MITIQDNTFDSSLLRKALPDAADSVYADALESMALALHSRGVSVQTINEAVEEAVEAYVNNT